MKFIWHFMLSRLETQKCILPRINYKSLLRITWWWDGWHIDLINKLNEMYKCQNFGINVSPAVTSRASFWFTGKQWEIWVYLTQKISHLKICQEIFSSLESKCDFSTTNIVLHPVNQLPVSPEKMEYLASNSCSPIPTVRSQK